MLFAQKKKRNGIRKKLLFVVLAPIGVLGAMIIIFGVILLYQSYTRSIQDELTSTTNILTDCLELTVRGDYSYEDGMLLKGDLNITDSTMLYRVKEKSEIDTTIFWQDTRILSTVEDEYGVSAVGTKAGPEVVEAVLKQGKDYYSNALDINGVTYIGYYKPLENNDHSIVGMVFAGKRRQLVYKKVCGILLWFLVFSVIAVIIAICLSRPFSNHMVSDINVINEFLKTISEGDLTVILDESIAGRNDELGAIGMYASKMENDLKKLIETDPLTSLYNRRSCNNKLHVLEKQGIKFCVVMCDIDWFKKINDNYGHGAGDYVLVAVSDIIQENIKDCGFASRWGGEEFLLVYQTDFPTVKEKVGQLQKRIREFDFLYNGETIKITMTFGIEAGDKDDSSEDKIKNSDKKLYIGKNNGRDQIVC